MKLLLTGATGFVGQHMLAALTACGPGVTCLVRRLPKQSAQANISYQPYAGADGTTEWQTALQDAPISCASKRRMRWPHFTRSMSTIP